MIEESRRKFIMESVTDAESFIEYQDIVVDVLLKHDYLDNISLNEANLTGVSYEDSVVVIVPIDNTVYELINNKQLVDRYDSLAKSYRVCDEERKELLYVKQFDEVVNSLEPSVIY